MKARMKSPVMIIPEDPVPDAVWEEAKKYYDEKGLAALSLAIATINVWNRLNAITRQVAGEWIASQQPQHA
jgi:alkylhydroperoxidase family enzyme